VAKRPTGGDRRVEIRGTMDRHAAEALRLELLRLARRYDIEVKAIRVERPEEERLA